jgi:hypothetical protein
MAEKYFITTRQFIHSFVHPSIHSIAMCRMLQFLYVFRIFFHSSLLNTFSCHSSPPTNLPSSLTPSSHLFLGQPLSLVDSKFIYTTPLGILFSCILCTRPNQSNGCILVCLFVCLFVGFSGSAAQRGLWAPRTTKFRDHTQRRATVGRTPLAEWSARRRDLYLTTHNTHSRQTSMSLVGFELTIAVGDYTITPILTIMPTLCEKW